MLTLFSPLRLDPGHMTKPYVNVHGEIARAETSLLLGDIDRQSSSKTRLIDGSGPLRQDSKKVRAPVISALAGIPMRKMHH